MKNTTSSDRKSALIIIDVQNDFTHGALGNDDAASKVPAIVAKAKSFEGRVFLTQDTHGPDYLKTLEGINLPIEHCIEGTPGWRMAAELDELAKTNEWKIYEKASFGSTELAHDLAILNASGQLDEVELVGFCTDICVVSNALLIKAFAPELRVKVNADLCSGTTKDAHIAAIKTMHSCQIEVTPSPRIS